MEVKNSGDEHKWILNITTMDQNSYVVAAISGVVVSRQF